MPFSIILFINRCMRWAPGWLGLAVRAERSKGRMKFWMKCLAVAAAAAVLFALYDSVFNGLMNREGYKPVTEQMREVKEP